MKLFARRVLNLLLYLSFCVVVGTGLLLEFRVCGHGLRALGWSRHQWGDIHTWVSYLFIALVMTHLLINWQWLIKVAASGYLWRIVLGLIAGLGFIAAFLFFPVK